MPAGPLFLAGLPVVAHVRIDGRQQPTGGTRHFVGGMRTDPAACLAICGDARRGFYLFGCDGDWNTVTDTWHETLEDALDQAEHEYRGVADTWEWPAGRPG